MYIFKYVPIMSHCVRSGLVIFGIIRYSVLLFPNSEDSFYLNKFTAFNRFHGMYEPRYLETLALLVWLYYVFEQISVKIRLPTSFNSYT